VIFVTVGAQIPFDRLVRAVDEWALSRERSDVFAQIGTSDFHARSIETTRFIDPMDFRKHVETATLIVSHAGMGTIITALEFGKPIIVMPRRADFKETRNDHQVETAKYLSEQGRIIVARNEQELITKLDQIKTSVQNLEPINPRASPQLIATLRKFVESNIK
jgi:UDP-N-acetylglucosamine transferase subunit ALG13